MRRMGARWGLSPLASLQPNPPLARRRREPGGSGRGRKAPGTSACPGQGKGDRFILPEIGRGIHELMRRPWRTGTVCGFEEGIGLGLPLSDSTEFEHSAGSQRIHTPASAVGILVKLDRFIPEHDAEAVTE